MTTINSKIITSINTNTTFFAYATNIIDDQTDMKMGNTQRSNGENNGKSANQGSSSKCCGSFSTLVLYLLVIAALLLVSLKCFYQ